MYIYVQDIQRYNKIYKIPKLHQPLHRQIYKNYQNEQKQSKPYNIYIYIYMKPARGPQTMFFGNDCCGIILVPTMKGQAKCAKAIFVSFFRYLGWRPEQGSISIP